VEPATKARVHFLLGPQNLAVDFLKFNGAGEAFFVRRLAVTQASPKAQSNSWSFPLNLASSSDSTSEGHVVSVNAVMVS